MTTEYTIYLVNKSVNTQLFWCFLDRPQELADDPRVFANSAASLAVDSSSPATNTFTIPVQYKIGAGASNKAVGLNIKVDSSITQNVNLQERWLADYTTVPPQKGPTLKKLAKASPVNTLAIQSNPFNQLTNEAAGWFSNMSFGIQTKQGFMGMTWSPDPNKRRTITPKLKFFVSAGDFGTNQLADWEDVANVAAEIDVPTSFKLEKCTVTYTPTGEWIVTPGAPS